MNIKTLTLALLVHAAFASPLAHAAPAGQVAQLSGFASSARAGGALKVLAPQSAIEAGDTLQSEPGAHVRIALPGGAEAILAPNTRVKLHASSIELLSGQMRFEGGVMASPAPFTVSAAGNTIQAGNATFEVFLVADPAARLAQQAYARAAMAALPGLVSDAGPEMPVWIAQVNIPLPKAPGASPLPSGLYVHVLDNVIHVSNTGGTQQFAAGQFGFTPSPTQPPVLVPKNPGVQFTLPVAFNTPASTSGANSSTKSNTVDCEVR